MLSTKEKELIRKVIDESLDKAEEHWRKGGHLLTESEVRITIAKAESEASKIPGHPIVKDGETIISEFIALVMDMRDSSLHLMNDISSKVSKVTMLERIYYETSALLPATALTIKFQSGNVTEYLGDGVLALFKVDSNDPEKTIREVYRVAKNILNDTRNMVNKVLYERYGLLPIDLGIGLAISKTLVSLIGLENEKHPKAFGQCVFRATKLSHGANEIYVDEILKKMWPKSDGGKLNFNFKQVGSVNGYLIN